MEKLPPDLQQEVRDFARFLVEKRAKPKRKKHRLTWAGGSESFATSTRRWSFKRNPSNGGATDPTQPNLAFDDFVLSSIPIPRFSPVPHPRPTEPHPNLGRDVLQRLSFCPGYILALLMHISIE